MNKKEEREKYGKYLVFKNGHPAGKVSEREDL